MRVKGRAGFGFGFGLGGGLEDVGGLGPATAAASFCSEEYSKETFAVGVGRHN